MKPKCVFSKCSNSKASTNKYEMCFRHGDILEFLLWVLPLIQMKTKEESMLWTPEEKTGNG